jgi:hypothetical protein
MNPDAVRSPRGLERLERDAVKRVRDQCPDVEWLSNYTVLGPCDHLDGFTANDIETATRVSTLIRTTALDGNGVGSIQEDRPHASWLDLNKTKFLPLRNRMIEDAECVAEFVLAGPGVEFTPSCLITVGAP